MSVFESNRGSALADGPPCDPQLFAGSGFSELFAQLGQDRTEVPALENLGRETAQVHCSS